MSYVVMMCKSVCVSVRVEHNVSQEAGLQSKRERCDCQFNVIVPL